MDGKHYMANVCHKQKANVRKACPDPVMQNSAVAPGRMQQGRLEWPDRRVVIRLAHVDPAIRPNGVTGSEGWKRP